jgi:signal transduction histidine kinase/response regulator of citrate/malate metabolism
MLIRELGRAGFTPKWKRVENESDFLAEIITLPDIILSDYSMPHFNGLRAVKLLQESGLDIPFILISGTVGEDVAVEAMQQGATDYLLKDRIGRLGIAVERALEQKRLRNERDLAEEALRKAGALQNAIFNSANSSIIATDPKGVIQIFNVGAERMLGYTASEVMNNVTPAEISNPQEVIARAEALSMELGTPIKPGFEALAFKASRGMEDTYELNYVRKDGSQLPAVVSVTALRDAQNSLLGYLLIGTDNTARKLVEEERKRFEQDLQKSNVELKNARFVAEDANLAKSQFLANMSHELRTPMNGIIGMTGMLRGTPLTQAQHEIAQTVQSSAEALLTIINDILDFSKVEAGKLEFEAVDIELPHVLAGALALMEGEAQAKGIEIHSAIDADVPARLRGDAGRLQQVLINLLNNAIKFTTQGEITLQISVDRQSDEMAALRFRVSDTGIGISPEIQERLFHAFAQGDSSITRKFGGTGLGLAICKQLVAKMRGDIGVESTLGHGSTFWFTVELEKQSKANCAALTVEANPA